MNDTNWPFDQSQNTATITLRSIMSGQAAILFVSHDLDDQGWQFLGGGVPDEADALLVALSEVVTHDPSVLKLADLPPGWTAERNDVDSPWVRRQSSGHE